MRTHWRVLFTCTGEFKRRLPRTPSTGTMSSADDLDEREPPSPSDNGESEGERGAGHSPRRLPGGNGLSLVPVSDGGVVEVVRLCREGFRDVGEGKLQQKSRPTGSVR